MRQKRRLRAKRQKKKLRAERQRQTEGHGHRQMVIFPSHWSAFSVTGSSVAGWVSSPARRFVVTGCLVLLNPSNSGVKAAHEDWQLHHLHDFP